MAGRRCRNQAPILISSDSEDAESSKTSESEYEFHDDDEDTCSSSSRDCESDASELSESDDERDDESSESEEIEEEVSDRDFSSIMRLLQGRCDPQELKLEECKAYLRKHGLRLSGTKDECIGRIMEHWRIKDGNGERFYPRSSFSIDCIGDVCKGDVVLFTQKVYKKFDKMTRSGNALGKRTVAGRIVKESYGAAKQQHTFTVEVLWSQGVKKLPPLFPLLVKGRNLYKLKTFRQRWKNEKERLGVLEEKHRRGAAARLARETRKMRSKKRKQSFTDKGSKRQKNDHSRPSQVAQSKRSHISAKENDIHKRGSNKSSRNRHGKQPPGGKQNVNQRRKFKVASSHQRPPYHANANQSYHQFQSEIYNRSIPHLYSWDTAYVPTVNFPQGSSSSSLMANKKQKTYGRYGDYGHRN